MNDAHEMKPDQLPKGTHESVTRGDNVLKRYRDTMVGRSSIFHLFYYEWCMLLGVVPGSAGLLMRHVFWPRLFGHCGKGTRFARNVIVRQPHRIHLGERVIISEGCILDARNQDTDQVIVIRDDVILSNNVMMSCKRGQISIGARTGIGAQTILHSSLTEPISIGEDCILGPRCYVTGGGNYHTEDLAIPISKQGKRRMGGSQLENGVWLGANVTVLGGVVMGQGSVAAAGAVVIHHVPDCMICGGVPAKVLKKRGSIQGEET